MFQIYTALQIADFAPDSKPEVISLQFDQDGGKNTARCSHSSRVRGL